MASFNPHDTEKLFKSIEDDNLSEVAALIEKYPRDRLIFNSANESAVSLALRFKRLKIYEFLLQSGFKLGPNEELDKTLSTKDKKAIRGIHRRCVKDPVPKHLLTLNAFSKLSHNSNDDHRELYFELIMEAFDELNGFRFIEAILKLVASSENLNIIFDFESDSVHDMDPTMSTEDSGSTYPRDKFIYIGAIGLLSDDTKSLVYGVLAHELCHYAMKLLYDNNCKPYRADDDEMCFKFENILTLCETNKAVEPYIASVYDYTLAVRHAELIVRVPHLIALYKDDADQFMECEEIFSDLFNFFEQNTFVDLEREYPLMDAKKIMKELNEICGVASTLESFEISLAKSLNLDLSSKVIGRVVKVKSNCPQLTLKTIFEELKASESFCIFIKLESLRNKKIFDSLLEAFNLKVNPIIVIDCEDHTDDQIENVARKLKLNDRIVFVTSLNSKFLEDEANEIIQINHSWKKLSEASQKYFLSSDVNFQGVKVSLKDVLVKNSEAIKIIEIQDLVKQKVAIGSELNFLGNEFYVERVISSSLEKDLELTSTDICDQNLLLLVNEPGMGKTTEFKFMAKKLKENFPLHWIIFIDLKAFIGAYQKDGNIKLTFHDREKVSTFISGKILKLESFEMKIFVELFNEDRVIFLFDGVDEISPSYKEFVMKMLLGTKNHSKNRLWISTRPHLAAELEKTLNTKSYKLKPFSKESQREFFERFIRNKHVSRVKIGKCLIEIHEFLFTLERRLGDEDDFVLNPMMMRMIAEILDSDCSNQLTQKNFYTIYETFTRNMVEKLTLKGSEAKNDLSFFATTSVSIFKFHQRNAFETVFGKDDDQVRRLAKLCFKETSTKFSEQIVRVGLMYDDGSEDLKFVHKTFAEFFVVNFIYNHIFMRESESNAVTMKIALKFFAKIVTKSGGDYKMIRNFLDDAVESFHRRNDECACKNTEQMFVKCVKGGDYEFFYQLAENGYINLIEKTSREMLEDKQKLFKLWLGRRDKGSILMTSIKFQSFTFIEKIWSLARELFNFYQLRQLIFNKNKDGENLFIFVVKHKRFEKCNSVLKSSKAIWINENLATFEFFLKISKLLLTEDELKNALITKDKTGICAFMKIAEVACSETMKKILESFSNEFLRQVLVSSYNEGVSLLMCIAGFSKDDIFEVVWSFFEKCFSGEELKEILMTKDSNRSTVLGYAKLRHEKQLKFIISLFIKNFGLDRTTKRFFKERKIDGNRLFDVIKHLDLTKPALRFLWSSMEKDYRTETLKMFLLNKSSDNKSIFRKAKDSHHLEMALEVLLPFIIKNFSLEEKRYVDLFSILFYTAENCACNFLVSCQHLQNQDCYKNFLKELLMEKSEDGKNVLHSALKNSNQEVFQKFYSEAKLELDSEFIDEIDEGLKYSLMLPSAVTKGLF